MIRRGDIHFVSLGPTRGREQAGRRPVLVVSSDAINALPLVVTVIPGTDGSKVRRDYPTNVRVPAAESGLPKDTLFLCFHLRSLDHDRFSGPAAGRVPPPRMREIEEAVRKVLELYPSPFR